jgi:hypothetical protein
VACVVTIARCGRHGGGKGPFTNAPEKAVCVTVQKLESRRCAVCGCPHTIKQYSAQGPETFEESVQCSETDVEVLN